LSERHDILSKENVSSRDSCLGSEKVYFVCPLVVAVTGDAEDRGKFAVLLELDAILFLRSDVRQAAPSFENAKVGVRLEENGESTSPHKSCGLFPLGSALRCALWGCDGGGRDGNG
jgi:hypothetical protein